ncbi:MAG TPA: hypothetical protein VGB04_00790 [Allosphingosinicella sp.]|jgi:hypothetical protein
MQQKGRDKSATSERPPLKISPVQLRERTKQLFSDLESPQARTDFLTNPLRRIAALYDLPVQEQKEASATRVLFSMLANDRFRTWLESYPSHENGKPVERSKFARDFAQALLDYGDDELIGNLLLNAANGHGFIGVEVFQQFVTGPEKTFATPAATPSSSSAKVESSQNFQHKGFGFGDFAAVNPAQLRAVMEQLIFRAKQLRDSGRLAVRNRPGPR